MMQQVNQFVVICQYHWQVKEFQYLYPNDTKLMSWPYISGKFVLSVNTYGDYCKVG